MADSSLCRLALTELDATDLAARRLGKLGDELDLSRILVRGGLGLAEVLYLARELIRRFVVLAENDVRLDDATAVLVRRWDHRALNDRLVLYEDTLDLEGTDAVAGGEDHVVRPAHEPQVPVLVPVRPVSGQVVTVPEDGLRLVGLVPVFFEERGDATGEGDVARLVRRALVAFGVENLHAASGGGLAHRAGPHFETREVADEQGVLRLAVAVVDRNVVQLLPPLDDRRVQGLARGDGVTDLREVRLLQLVRFGEEPVLGRGLAEDRDPVVLDQVQPLGGVEAALVEEDLRPPAPRPEVHVPDALGPPRPGGAPEPISFLEI